ncbi:hypothetical protein DFH09DRAFT_1155644 [Mycena vulgaris]|nr:hypothetical protein DFH09DRAFT_1155644 [Mycena vulgaris]
MHRCLQIFEVLEIICSQLISLPPGKRSLAALARTCKQLGGPALDCLWREQDTLGNILSCMPSSLFDISKDISPHSVRRPMRMLRPIIATDWDRPLIYAHRVRSLLSVSIVEDEGLRDILLVVSSCFPGHCLFPNLKTLRWMGSGNDFLYMRMVLAPTLTSISFSCESSNGHLSLLPVFVRTCPALKDLTIVLDDVGDPARSVVSDLTSILGDIESLNMDVPDLAALEHIARLPTLTCLTVRSFPAASSSTSPLHFPALNRLEFNLDDIYPATKFLQNCSDISLVGLDLTLHCCYPSTALEKFCTALKAACTHTSLLSLSIDDGQADDIPGNEDEDAFNISIQSIQTLFCFRNLTSVVITSKIGFDLDNSAITDLACAWPHVTTLFLISETQKRPCNSLDCLYSLAQHCPELERLHITFDASHLPSNASVVDRRISHQRLKFLNVAQSPITAPTLSVARVISALFPGLEDLSTYCIGDEDEDDDEDDDEPGERGDWRRLWGEVEEHLPVLVAIRAEERVWARENLGP